MRELDTELRFKMMLEREGWSVLKFGSLGLPDRICIKGTFAAWAEFKTPKGRLTVAQKRRIPKLQDAGQLVLVVTDAIVGAEELLALWNIATNHGVYV